MDSSLTPTELIIEKTHEFVGELMSKPPFDASHNYDHVCKVHQIALNLLHSESLDHPEIHYDRTIVTLGALLHDALDHKYLPVPSIWTTLWTTFRGFWKKSTPATPLDFLLSISCPPETAQVVQVICDAVSFSRERKEPDVIRGIIASHPELAIVQDADRLESLGAMGIARAFTFGASPRGGARDMDFTMTWLPERSTEVAAMMKTDMGKREARAGLEKIMTFQSWYQAEKQGNVGVDYQNWAAIS